MPSLQRKGPHTTSTSALPQQGAMGLTSPTLPLGFPYPTGVCMTKTDIVRQLKRNETKFSQYEQESKNRERQVDENRSKRLALVKASNSCARFGLSLSMTHASSDYACAANSNGSNSGASTQLPLPQQQDLAALFPLSGVLLTGSSTHHTLLNGGDTTSPNKTTMSKEGASTNDDGKALPTHQSASYWHERHPQPADGSSHATPSRSPRRKVAKGHREDKNGNAPQDEDTKRSVPSGDGEEEKSYPLPLLSPTSSSGVVSSRAPSSPTPQKFDALATPRQARSKTPRAPTTADPNEAVVAYNNIFGVGDGREAFEKRLQALAEKTEPMIDSQQDKTNTNQHVKKDKQQKRQEERTIIGNRSGLPASTRYYTTLPSNSRWPPLPSPSPSTSQQAPSGGILPRAKTTKKASHRSHLATGEESVAGGDRYDDLYASVDTKVPPLSNVEKYRLRQPSASATSSSMAPSQAAAVRMGNSRPVSPASGLYVCSDGGETSPTHLYVSTFRSLAIATPLVSAVPPSPHTAHESRPESSHSGPTMRLLPPLEGRTPTKRDTSSQQQRPSGPHLVLEMLPSPSAGIDEGTDKDKPQQKFVIDLTNAWKDDHHHRSLLLGTSALGVLDSFFEAARACAFLNIRFIHFNDDRAIQIMDELWGKQCVPLVSKDGNHQTLSDEPSSPSHHPMQSADRAQPSIQLDFSENPLVTSITVKRLIKLVANKNNNAKEEPTTTIGRCVTSVKFDNTSALTATAARLLDGVLLGRRAGTIA